MRRLATILAVSTLLLAGAGGAGLDLHHGRGPSDLTAHEEGPRFGSGHERPISDTHVESAVALPEDHCLACALRTGSEKVSLLTGTRAARPPAAALSVARAVADGPEHDLRTARGRAPPAA